MDSGDKGKKLKSNQKRTAPKDLTAVNAGASGSKEYYENIDSGVKGKNLDPNQKRTALKGLTAVYSIASGSQEYYENIDSGVEGKKLKSNQKRTAPKDLITAVNAGASGSQEYYENIDSGVKGKNLKPNRKRTAPQDLESVNFGASSSHEHGVNIDAEVSGMNLRSTRSFSPNLRCARKCTPKSLESGPPQPKSQRSFHPLLNNIRLYIDATTKPGIDLLNRHLTKFLTRPRSHVPMQGNQNSTMETSESPAASHEHGVNIDAEESRASDGSAMPASERSTLQVSASQDLRARPASSSESKFKRDLTTDIGKRAAFRALVDRVDPFYKHIWSNAARSLTTEQERKLEDVIRTKFSSIRGNSVYCIICRNILCNGSQLAETACMNVLHYQCIQASSFNGQWFCPACKNKHEPSLPHDGISPP